MKEFDQFRPSGLTMMELVGSQSFESAVEEIAKYYAEMNDGLCRALAHLLNPLISKRDVESAGLSISRKLRIAKALVLLPAFSARIDVGRCDPSDLLDELTLRCLHAEKLAIQFSDPSWRVNGIDWDSPGGCDPSKVYRFRERIDDADAGFIQDVSDNICTVGMDILEIFDMDETYSGKPATEQPSR